MVSNHLALSSDQETDKSPRGLNKDYIKQVMVGDCHQPDQFPVLYREHDLQWRFELVLMFSTAESLSPTQNLTITHNSMSSLDFKQCFEVMAITRCCEVTAQHSVFKFSGNDAEMSH